MMDDQLILGEMEITRSNKWTRLLKNIVLWPFLGAVGLALFFDWRDIQAEGWTAALDTLAISFIFWSVLANGNNWVIHQLEKRWSWLDQPVKRGIMTFVAMSVFTVVLSLIVIAVYVQVFFGYTFWEIVEMGQLPYLLVTPLIITGVVALFAHGREFLIAWRQAAINVERLKTENMKSRFDSLRNQVNPHFLFNSLNALSSLVYSDQNKAESFIHKLSDVYRYLLDHQSEETISLRAEIEFLKSFVFLNKIRFGDNLEVNFHNLDNLDEDWEVPPVVTQMLMENCLKHNEASKSRKLNVEVAIEGDMLTITNNINPLTTAKKHSNGVGLNNISARYKLLTDREIRVTQDAARFKVAVPLLKVE